MFLKDKILITGAAGTIGSELYRQLVKQNDLFAVDINETALFDLHEEHKQKGFDVKFRIGDVRNRHTVREVLEWKPDVIYHCAALKHVYPNELFPREAVETNVVGTLNIVEEAKRTGVKKLIYISTDKVINSYSVMGTTKRLGELIVKNAGYVSVRFGNVLGSRGSVIPIWQRQLNQGEPLTVTDEHVERFFMSIQEACSLVIEAGKMGHGGEIIVMNMGERKNILQLAKEILGKAGKEDHPINIIGLRPGETLKEELMTEEERKNAKQIGNFYIL